MKKTLFYAFCIGLLSSLHAQASVLIGTFTKADNPSISELNQLINDYNSDFGTSLNLITAEVDKIEGDNSADFLGGVLSKADFTFYVEDEDGSILQNIFNETVNFSLSTLGTLDEPNGFDELDKNVQGFAYDGVDVQFEYYVSKDGQLGWSLWLYSESVDVNPLYTDLGDGTNSITGVGYTRGDISDSSLDYDPIKNGISHISFYNRITPPDGDGDPDNIAPEPASMAIFGLGALGMGWMARRRRQTSGIAA